MDEVKKILRHPIKMGKPPPGLDLPSLTIRTHLIYKIVCFFVAKSYRRRGATEKLIQAAVEYVREQGGKVVEAYPTAPKSDRVPFVSGYIGFPSMFENLGRL